MVDRAGGVTTVQPIGDSLRPNPGRSVFDAAAFAMTGIDTQFIPIPRSRLPGNIVRSDDVPNEENYTGSFGNAPMVGPTQNMVVVQGDVLDFEAYDENLPNEGATFSFNPFRLVYHGIKVPVLGYLSLTVEKSKAGIQTWFSWVYKSFGLLSSKIRLESIGVGTARRAGYKQTPTNFQWCTTCPALCTQTPEHLFVARAPWIGCICPHNLARAIEPNAAMARFMIPPPAPNCPGLECDASDLLLDPMTCLHAWSREFESFDPSMLCEHADNPLPAHPFSVWDFEESFDKMLYLDPAKRHRCEENANGLRCTVCHTTMMHGLHPKVVAAMNYSDWSDLSLPARTMFVSVFQRWIGFTTMLSQQHPKVYLTATSPERDINFAGLEFPVIILMTSYQAAIHVVQRGVREGKIVIPFIVPNVGSPRHLAGWRLLLAMATTAPMRLMVVNCVREGRMPSDINTIWRVDTDFASMCTGHVWPCFAGALLFKSPAMRSVNVANLLPSFLAHGHVYGWDETIMAVRADPVVVTAGKHKAPGMCIPLIDVDWKPTFRMALLYTNNGAAPDLLHTFVARRGTLYYMRRFLDNWNPFESLGFFDVLTDSRTIAVLDDNTQRQIWGPGDPAAISEVYWDTLKDHPYDHTSPTDQRGINVLHELTSSLGGIWIHTLGTHGDYIPMVAFKNYLRSLGGVAYVQRLCTIPEGLRLLDSALGNPGADHGNAARVFNRARLHVQSMTTGLHWSPANLQLTGLSYSFVPPKDVIRYFVPTAKLILNIAYGILAVFAPEPVRIGAYWRPGWLPRSADGENFLEQVRNDNTIPQLAAWGSDNTGPSQWSSVPVVEPGDHVTQFAKASQVVCHGGAGTVQTAAACGARVTSIGTKLDRAYRDPNDAGVGVHAGAPPDRLFLALSQVDMRFFAIWLRRNWYKPWELMAWLGPKPLAKVAFRLLMLYIIYSREHRQTIVSTDALTTLLLVVFRAKPDLRKMLVVFCIARCVDRVLDILNIDYATLIKHFVSLNWDMSGSFLGIYLAQRYNVAAGMLWAGVAPTAYRVADLVFGSFIATISSKPTVLGASPKTVYLEYTLMHYLGAPYFHTALVCDGERYEGGGVAEGDLYEFAVRPGPVKKGSVLIKTGLDWGRVKTLPNLCGRYSMAWNCQTGLVIQLRTMLPLLGVGGIALLATAGIASLGYGVAISFGYLYLGLTAFIPQNVGLASTSNSGPEMLLGRLIADLSDRLMTPGNYLPAEILDWWRTLNFPFADGNPQDGVAIEALREFLALPILYQGDPDTRDRVARSLGLLALQGMPGTRIAMLQAAMYNTDDPETAAHAQYKHTLEQYRRLILADPIYQNLYLGMPGPSKEELLQKYLGQVPRAVFNSIIGGRLDAVAMTNFLLPLRDRKLVQTEFVRLGQVLNELAGSFDFYDQYDALLAELQQTMPLVSVAYIAFVLAAGSDVVPERFGIPPVPLPVTTALTQGLSKHIGRIPEDAIYIRWWHNTHDLLDKLNIASLRAIFASHFEAPEAISEPETDLDVLLADPIVRITGELGAALNSIGVHDYVIEGLMRIVPAALMECQKSEVSTEYAVRKWLWKVYLGHNPSIASVPERIAEYVRSVRRFCETHSLPFTVLASFVNLLTTIGLQTYNVLDRLIETFVGVLNTINNFALSTLQEYLYLGRAFLSLLLPEQRRRPKAVWALLFANDFKRLTPNEKFLLSCKVMDDPPVDWGYFEWANHVVDELNRTGIPDEKLEVKEPVRPVYYPNRPMTVDAEMLALAPLAPSKMNEAKIYQPFVKSWLDSGVAPNMTGMWFATPERVAKSIQRYEIARPSEDDAIKALVLQVADAMADHYPDIYQDGKWMHPSQTIKNLKVKYSPGNPFIGTYKSRKDLQKHGFLKAIEVVITKRLEEGINPGTMAHAFTKDGLVAYEGLTRDVPKDLRTVVAQDLLGNVQKWCGTLYSTRRLPPIDSWKMNSVPRSEGGFSPAFAALADRLHAYLADARKFDSTIAPVVSVDGLAHLRMRAFDNHPGRDIIESQVYSSYRAMRHCKIRDVQYNREFGHNGGLMTGQSDTAKDNDDSFRIICIAAWSLVTNRHPSEFWIYNTLVNSGDDDIWGSNEDRATMDHVMKVMEEKFGVIMEIEAEGLENCDLTGLLKVPVPPHSVQYYKNLGMAVPDFSVACTREKLLAKKTEFRLRESRFSDVAFYMHHVDSLIGSAWLTCHHPGIYEELWDAYKAEANYVLNRFFTKVIVHESRDVEGHLVAAHLTVGPPRERYMGKTDNVLLWLRNHTFPTYEKIFKVWVKPIDQSTSRMLKTQNKVMSWVPTVPYMDRVTYGLIEVREMLYKHIPNHMVRSLPEFAGEDVSYILRTQDHTIAKFVWLCLFHKLGKTVPTATAFRTALRENPYGSAEDPIGFLDWLSVAGNLEELVASDLEAYRGQMFTVTVIYYFIETIFKSFSTVPGLGWVIHLFALSTRDVNRLYAMLNFVYMLSVGRSSPIISNMMPNDPYAWIKQFSVIMANTVPTRWHKYPGLRHVVAVVPALVEMWAALNIATHPRVFNYLVRKGPPPEWQQVSEQVDNFMCSNAPSATVLAPTATGKSTAFISHLFLAPRRFGTLWLCCPTNVAVQAYENDFIDPEIIQKMSHGVVNLENKYLKVLTYGHAVQRYFAGEIRTEDLVFFDEMHLNQPEMNLLYMMAAANKKLIVTATPLPTLPNTGDHVYRYAGGRRFEIQAEHTSMDFPSLWSYLAANQPEILKRALVVVPTITEVHRTIMTLGRLNVAAFELSSDQPNPSPVGVIVSTTIVDTAVTIQPGPTCLIDFGTTIQITLTDSLNMIPVYDVAIVKTTPSINTQRKGRVGRLGKGVAFQFSGAGTAPEQPIRPTAMALLGLNSFVHELCAIYGTRIVCDVVNDAATLIRYFKVHPGVAMMAAHELTAAVAYYIATWLSSGLTLDKVKNMWLNHRLASPSETIEVIVINDIMEMGYGNPLSADFDMGVDFLMAGGLAVTIDHIDYPAACLVNRGSIIIPPNLPFQNYLSVGIGGTIDHPYHRVSSHALSLKRDDWLIAMHRGIIEEEPPLVQLMILRGFDPVGDFAPVATNFSSGALVELANRVVQHTRRWPGVRRIALVFDHDEVPNTNMRTLYLSTNEAYDMRGLNDNMPVHGIFLGYEVSRVCLAFLIAATFPDDTYAYWGDVPDEVYIPARKSKFSFMTYNYNDTFESGFVSAEFARAHSHRLVTLARLRLADAYLASIPRYQLALTMPLPEGVAGPNVRAISLDERGRMIYY